MSCELIDFFDPLIFKIGVPTPAQILHIESRTLTQQEDSVSQWLGNASTYQKAVLYSLLRLEGWTEERATAEKEKARGAR